MLPAPPPKKRLSLLQIILIVIGTIVGLAIVVAVGLFVLLATFFQSYGHSCEQKRAAVSAAANTGIPIFNQLTIIPGQSGTPAQVGKQEGDCVDSLPTVYATRTVKVNESAAAAMSQVTGALQSQGYAGPIAASGNTAGTPCDPNRLSYSKPGRQGIEISLQCNGPITGTWQSQPVSRVDAYVTFTSQP